MRNDDSTRQIIRSRTTLSYAFEAAIRRVLGEEGHLNSDRGTLATWASQALPKANRKTPTWTVTRKEPRR